MSLFNVPSCLHPLILACEVHKPEIKHSDMDTGDETIEVDDESDLDYLADTVETER